MICFVPFKSERNDYKMMVVKKKQIVTVAMALILVMAGYINYVYIDKEEENLPVATNIEESVENYGEAQFVSAPDNAKEDYFNLSKTNKDKVRSEAIALIKEVSENENADYEAKKTAQTEMLKIAKNIEKEGNIENILMNKGFSNVSAFINEERVTVSVLTDGLEPSDVAKIRDVVIAETGMSADKININEIK